MFQMYNLITYNVHTDICAQKANERRVIVRFTLSKLERCMKKLRN